MQYLIIAFGLFSLLLVYFHYFIFMSTAWVLLRLKYFLILLTASSYKKIHLTDIRPGGEYSDPKIVRVHFHHFQAALTVSERKVCSMNNILGSP